MNKNTIIGLLLIVGILVVFGIVNSPSKEEKLKIQREKDSITRINIEKEKQNAIKLASHEADQKTNDTAKSIQKNYNSADSAATKQAKDELGIFAGSLNGSKKLITIENEVTKFKFSNLGGRIYYVQLKKYRTFDSLPLILMNGDSTMFKFIFNVNNRTINTDKLYFTPVIADAKYSGKDSISIKGNDSIKLSMRVYPDSSVNPQRKKYFELQYTIYGNDNMMKLHLNIVGMPEIISENVNGIWLEWQMDLRQQEKSLKAEKMASTIYYKYYEDEVNYLSETKDSQKKLSDKISWIGFKQQFFSSVLIADKGFSLANNNTISTLSDTNNRILKKCFAQVTVPINDGNFPMRMYFGPNHYKTLRKYHLDLEHQIPLGWSSPYIFGWINRIAVIPVFNWLESTGMNYGIIILILTILLKVVLFPIAYKTYMSSAKMRVLKPEIDEINKKIPKEKAMERQQATMALYKKAGVNPLAGCIPMLLQLPIIYAFFRFFPAAIELRQQHFLWATDLSSYDSIYSWSANIPILSSVYGNHISLFTLLMTVSTIFYTKLNNQLMGSQQQMPGMKFMMYAMPVMFLGIFNNLSSGLSYYYFLANMFTFLQMWVIRRSVNEEAIHAKIQENKKKPAKAKSGFQKRLEDMAKQRGYNPPKK
jgi:YidC/Oxa1 family membrane protein insertase